VSYPACPPRRPSTPEVVKASLLQCDVSPHQATNLADFGRIERHFRPCAENHLRSVGRLGDVKIVVGSGCRGMSSWNPSPASLAASVPSFRTRPRMLPISGESAPCLHLIRNSDAKRRRPCPASLSAPTEGRALSCCAEEPWRPAPSRGQEASECWSGAIGLPITAGAVAITRQTRLRSDASRSSA
jgi:hypothetical protein